MPVLVGLWPLTSYKQALRLNNEVPGIVIPRPVLREMEKAGEAGARPRIWAWRGTCCNGRRGAQVLGIAGTYLIPPFKRYEEILEIF